MSVMNGHFTSKRVLDTDSPTNGGIRQITSYIIETIPKTRQTLDDNRLSQNGDLSQEKINYQDTE